MSRATNYRGGMIVIPDDVKYGRTIQSGETVRVNADGRTGVVGDRCEGNYVFWYLVRFPGSDTEYRFATNAITPLVNP